MERPDSLRSGERSAGKEKFSGAEKRAGEEVSSGGLHRLFLSFAWWKVGPRRIS
jgi:hypothetical protein